MKLVTLMVSVEAKVQDNVDPDSLTLEFDYATAHVKSEGETVGRVVGHTTDGAISAE